MLTIKVVRVGSRVERISAAELYVRLGYEKGLFVLTPDDRLLPIGTDVDWRRSVATVTGAPPESGDVEGQAGRDVLALEAAFASPET